MADEDRGSSEQERKIARQRDELLAQARGEKSIGFTEKGVDPRMMGLGLQFVIAILLSLYAGMWVDAKLKTSPWFTLIGGVLGASAGFYSMYRVLLDVNKKYDEQDKQDKLNKLNKQK